MICEEEKSPSPPLLSLCHRKKNIRKSLHPVYISVDCICIFSFLGNELNVVLLLPKRCFWLSELENSLNALVDELGNQLRRIGDCGKATAGAYYIIYKSALNSARTSSNRSGQVVSIMFRTNTKRQALNLL